MVEEDASVALAAAEAVEGVAIRSDVAVSGIGDMAGTSEVSEVREAVCVQGSSAIAALNGSSLPASGSEGKNDVEDSLFPRAHELPARPPRAIECNYTHWAALGKP